MNRKQHRNLKFRFSVFRPFYSPAHLGNLHGIKNTLELDRLDVFQIATGLVLSSGVALEQDLACEEYLAQTTASVHDELWSTSGSDMRGRGDAYAYVEAKGTLKELRRYMGEE